MLIILAIYYYFIIVFFMVSLQFIKKQNEASKKEFAELKKRYKNPTIEYDSREYYLTNECAQCYSKDTDIEINEKHWLVPCDEIPDMVHALPAIPTLKKYNYIRMGYSDLKGVTLFFPKEIPATNIFDLISYKLGHIVVQICILAFSLFWLFAPFILYWDEILGSF